MTEAAQDFSLTFLRVKLSHTAYFISLNGLLLIPSVHHPHVKCIVGDQISPQSSTGTIS